MSYIPKTGEISYYPEINIDVELTNSNIHPYYRGSNDDARWVATLVDNPEMINNYQRGSLPTFGYNGGLCDTNESYDYVIITRNALVDFTATYNWSDLITINLNRGLTTKIVPYEDILACPDYYNSTYLFNDSAARVREFLRDAYQDWGIEYVLIAGDQDGVSAIPRRLMDSYAESNVESDLYWSNLDNTFNDDMDGNWGEEYDSGFDLYSELFIGSIPCDEGLDISNWLTKSFYYENSYELDYLDNAAFYGGNTGWQSQGDDFIDFTIYGTNNWLGPDPNHDGPWPSWLGFLYGFDTWNAMYPDMAFNISVRWTAEPPNPGWMGGSETAAINGLKNAISDDNATLISGIAHANADMSLDVYSSAWESQYHNTKPFFMHDYGCHCGDMDGASDGVLHSMLFHSDTELAFAVIFNTGYGWGNLYCTNSSSALQQKLFWDYLFNFSKSGGIENWQLGKAQAYSKDAMAPTIYYEDTFREIIQVCLLFGDPAQRLKSPIIPDRRVTEMSENWNFISLPFNENLEKTELFISYNGTNYTWMDAATNNNPTGSPIIDSNTFGWDKTNQTYSMVIEFVPGEGYWVYSYSACEIWARNITRVSSNQIADIAPDWNIIGLPDDEAIPKTDLIITYSGSDYTWGEATSTNNPTGFPMIDTNIFGWLDAYQTYDLNDTINPVEAYLLYAYQTLLLNKNS